MNSDEPRPGPVQVRRKRLGYPTIRTVRPILNELARHEARCGKLMREISKDCNGHSGKVLDVAKIARAISEEIGLGEGSVIDEATKSFLDGKTVLCTLPTDLQRKILSRPEFRVPEPSFSTVHELPRDDDGNLELPLFLTLCDVSPTFRKSCFQQLIDSWKLPLTRYKDGSFEIDYQKCGNITRISRRMSDYHFGNKHGHWWCEAWRNDKEGKCKSTIDGKSFLGYNVGGFTAYSAYTLTDGCRRHHIPSCHRCSLYDRNGKLVGLQGCESRVHVLKRAITEVVTNPEGSEENKKRVKTTLEKNLEDTRERLNRRYENLKGDCVFSGAFPDGIDIEEWPVDCPDSQHTKLVTLKHVAEKEMSEDSEHFAIVKKVVDKVPDAKCCEKCRLVLSEQVAAASGKTCGVCDKTKSSIWIKSKKDASKDLCKSCYEKELGEMADKTCGECSATKSSRWYKSKKDASKDLCDSCYYKELAELADKTCGECSATKSSKWHKSKKDASKDLCRSCYEKELAELANKTCGECDDTKSSRWHKSKKDASKDLCRSCYEKELVELANKTCGECDDTKSTEWYKSKKDASKDLCQNCYRKELAELANKTCGECSATKSCTWYKSKEDRSKDLCRKCYGKLTGN